MNISISLSRKLATLLLLSLLTACGGGGGSDNTPTPPPIVIDNIPVAVADTYTTDEDVAVTGNVSSNDTGLQDAPVTYVVATAPASGSLSLATNGQFTYTPAAGFSGEITFIYRVTDSDGDSATTTVTITVNAVVVDTQPVANDDSYTTAQDETLNGNVSTNDTGLTDAPVAYSVVSQPTNGSLNLATTGSFEYTPTAGFNGADTFSYRVTDDDGDSDTANVDITITAITTGVVWPAVTSEITTNVDADIAQVLAQMTTAEKVGQIIMAEIQSVTPEQAKAFNLGAVLNGGGSWPNNGNRSTAADWVALADAYYLASTDVTDGGVGIPLIWGTDAVHGHNNVYGATIFPHNIGLGAANNETLMEDIGRLTALQVLATGIEWT
ncbi:MAG: tandem-95 repeat protein, partial [Enterobacterales bacterium]|nr:tandem-95 repeat protein [Enterobacterales bacterium]